jgi:hypothetical protein
LLSRDQFLKPSDNCEKRVFTSDNALFWEKESVVLENLQGKVVKKCGFAKSPGQTRNSTFQVQLCGPKRAKKPVNYRDLGRLTKQQVLRPVSAFFLGFFGPKKCPRFRPQKRH